MGKALQIRGDCATLWRETDWRGDALLDFWSRGLNVFMRSAAADVPAEVQVTEEAALLAEPADDLRVDPVVAEGEMIAQGAPLFRLHRQPEVTICAAMPASVARLDLAPGRRLRNVTLFHEPGPGRYLHEVADANDPSAIRRTLLASGLWTMFRSRPFGRHPAPGETPAAIFVMAVDTRPGAVDPRQALAGREEAFARGMAALSRIGAERLFLCQHGRAPLVEPAMPGLRVLEVPALHPNGLAGVQIHRHCPAAPGARVWDIAAEDVAAIGTLLDSGHLPETRLVSVVGGAMRQPRLVRCQPWADLRSLSLGHLRPGPHRHVSGSVLDGAESRWLRPRDRQATVLPQASRNRDRHWFLSALSGARRPLPLIPTAAVEQSLSGMLPAMPLLRALSAGDSEAAVRLGALSLLAEDLALADYVTGAKPRLGALLTTMLAEIEAEDAT